MPVPGGEITSTETWLAPVEEVVEAIAFDEDAVKAEEAIAFDEDIVKAKEHPATTEEEVEDDLPELS